MIGKKYTDLTTGKIVTVKEIFEDIVILDDNSKVKLNRLSDRNFFDDYIDPNDFFKNESLLNSFASKIRQIPEEIINNITEDGINENVNLNNIPGSTSIRPVINESAILPSDPELEKEELMRKYNISQSNSNITEANRQFEKFQDILKDENEEVVQRIEINRDNNGDLIDINTGEVFIDGIKKEAVVREITLPKIEDPIISMFKNCKRNTDLKISIDIENKIPRPDFIEMMEDSYNTSIIDFLATEFTNIILDNPNIIKEKILNEINRIVYGEPKEDIKEDKIVITTVTSNDREKLNEGVDKEIKELTNNSKIDELPKVESTPKKIYKPRKKTQTTK